MALVMSGAISVSILVAGRALTAMLYGNTLQLILYIPLVQTALPANVHDFLNDYLQVIRLNLFELDMVSFSLEVGEQSYIAPVLKEAGV